MNTSKKTEVKSGIYYVLSGEGEVGNWKKIKISNIAKTLEQERCNGDRWAFAYGDIYETQNCEFAGHNVETGELKIIPTEIIESAATEA